MSKNTQTDWYTYAMEHLVKVVQALSQARTVKDVAEIVRIAARDLTGADGATFVLRDGDQCYYAEENAISPLWKGKRFPMKMCISGWVMLHAEPVIIKDIYKDSRIPHDAYRPTFVKSLAMVPIRRDNPIGAIGNYWAMERQTSQEEIAILQALADTTSVAMENVKLYTDLKTNLSIIQEREARIHAQHDTLEIFTRALAHDLKEPVRTINSFTEMLLQEHQLPGRAADYFHHIHVASNRMSTLIDTVFLYMQLDNPQNTPKEECDMNVLVREVVGDLDPLVKSKKARIIYDDLPIVYANHAHMMQLLQNLITNAIYHNNKALEIRISAEKQEGAWLFRVEDNGIGIDEKQVKKIFLPFKRASQESKGIGLGLAICNRIIAVHHGAIWCESQPGKGATFLFTVPIASGQEKSLKEDSVAVETVVFRSPSLANLLLVDDMDSDLDYVDATFRRHNIQCNLFKVRSGQDALDFLMLRQQEEAPIDIVLLDINMPEMDGFETLEKIQADKVLARTNIIMCTGSTYSKDKERAELLGAVGYLLKPIRKDCLKSIIDSIPNFQFYQTTNGYNIQYKT